MTTPKVRKIVVAVGGASGSIYAQRLLASLARLQEQGQGLEVALCFSRAGEEVWKHEIGAPVADSLGVSFRRYGLNDFHAPFASGSAGWDAMVVIPCSSGGLARIAHGISDDLIGRAADVMLKERRPLVLVFREAPLSMVHLENMTAAARAGATILPASPSFYSHPTTLEALVDTVNARVLDHLGVDNRLMPRWGDPSANPEGGL